MYMYASAWPHQQNGLNHNDSQQIATVLQHSAIVFAFLHVVQMLTLQT